MSVLWSPLHEIRGVFDLMPTEGEEAVAAIASRLAGVPAALEGLRVTLSDEARKGNVVAARQYAEVAEQVRRWTGQSGEAGDFYLGLVERLQGGDRDELRALARCRERRHRGVRAVPHRRARAAGRASARVSGGRSTRWRAATSSARRSTSTRPTPGAGPSCSGCPT